MARKAGANHRRIRCAIYTRKSSDEGLEQEFNSLHAQREACESYIASQRHEGWHVLAAHYDDGGYSGGTMERPALQRLLGDIAAGKVGIVVVYKIDRLTRSLFDFAKIVEAFDAKAVSFVSVTQAFNTTTSMGRLTLKVLLSFAQFEREVTSERIRDKIAASKQKGMGMGGAGPLGYDAVDRKLKVNTVEAQTVRLLFELYLELGSVRELQAECDRRGLRTKLRTLLDGRRMGGAKFSRGHLYRILSSPIYIGRIPHRDRSYEGEHAGIIDAETWEKVQAQLAANAGRKRGRANSKNPSLLAGLLFTAEGIPLTPSHTVNHGRRYRYYVEQPPLMPKESTGRQPSHESGENEDNAHARSWRLPAHPIEQLVLKQLAALLRDRAALLNAAAMKQVSPDIVSAVLQRASDLAAKCQAGSVATQIGIVAAIVRRIAVAQDQIEIEIARLPLVNRLTDQDVAVEPNANKGDPIIIDVPVKFRRRGVEAKLIVQTQRADGKPDPNLIKALSRAHDWFGKMARGEASLDEIARSESLCRTYIIRVLCLVFLAPELTKLILEGRQPAELTAKRLIRSALNMPLLWPSQIALVLKA